jgi:hypothetical protein
MRISIRSASRGSYPRVLLHGCSELQRRTAATEQSVGVGLSREAARLARLRPDVGQQTLVLKVELGEVPHAKDLFASVAITFEYEVSHRESSTQKYILRARNDRPLPGLAPPGLTEFLIKRAVQNPGAREPMGAVEGLCEG